MIYPLNSWKTFRIRRSWNGACMSEGLSPGTRRTLLCHSTGSKAVSRTLKSMTNPMILWRQVEMLYRVPSLKEWRMSIRVASPLLVRLSFTILFICRPIAQFRVGCEPSRIQHPVPIHACRRPNTLAAFQSKPYESPSNGSYRNPKCKSLSF